jgi:uncharacterized surface protein with fasciclin (FAS1) repeats
MKKYALRPFVILLMLLLLVACRKNKADGLQIDNSRIPSVLADNFNLSLFSAAVKRGQVDKTLREEGPFTVLAPSDAAFEASGLVNVTTSSPDVLFAFVNHHVMDGRFELQQLPYQFNKEFTSRNGKLYITRWIKGLDTAITVNGARILRANIPASNGSIQVINRVLPPSLHTSLADAVASDENLTLFAQAMKVAGLLDTLAGKGPFTVFALSNDVMNAQGYATMQQVNDAAPATLKKFLSYHILRDRRFISDYILSSDATDTNEQLMMDGNKISIGLLADPGEPGGYRGIYLTGTGNTDNVYVQRQDILAGNGVLHILNGALLLAQ